MHHLQGLIQGLNRGLHHLQGPIQGLNFILQVFQGSLYHKREERPPS